MNIGIVCYPTYGGSGVVATELGKSLALKGHDVHFISHNRPARLNYFSDKLHYHEVSFLDYPLFEYPPYELALTNKLVDVAKFAKLDLVHVHYAIPHAYAAYMAKQILKTQDFSLPIVTTLHGTDITLLGRDASYEPAISFCINNSDGVTAVSDYLKKETYKHFNVQNDIQVIPNFIDLERFNKNVTSTCKKSIAPGNEKIIVHTSNFRKVKRVEDVVKVFARIRNEMPAKLVLIGDGPERNNVEQACRKMPFCGDVHFLGKIDAIEEVLSMGDLFVLTSEQESFGLSSLEAMACGMPVISTNAGGITEVNVHGESGFVSEIGDTDDMGNNALHILEDEERHQKFRQNAINRAKKFEINKILPLYEKAYEAVKKETVESPLSKSLCHENHPYLRKCCIFLNRMWLATGSSLFC